VRKEGASFDLPISIGILAVTGVIRREKLDRYIILGELSLRRRGEAGARSPHARRDLPTSSSPPRTSVRGAWSRGSRW